MIDLVNVTKTYETGTHALNGIDMHIDDGEFVFLVGPSGSGKSTIIKLLTAELKPRPARCWLTAISSSPSSARPSPICAARSALFSRTSASLRTRRSMRTSRSPCASSAQREGDQKARAYVLELVGLENKGRRLPNELSGGEQQRVAIARALINNPTMIIADEPTGNLDPQRSFEIMLLLEQINALGTTVMVVTHEKGLVDRFTKRVVASTRQSRQRRNGRVLQL